MSTQGYVITDSAAYAALQSGFGVAAPTMKGAVGITDYDVEPVKDTIEAVPMLGRGYWKFQDLPAGVSVNWSLNGWGSLTQLAAFIATFCSGLKGSSTTLATTGFSHPYTMNTKNASKKYMTLAIIENEASAGVGLKKIFVRDCVASSVVINIVSKQAFTFEARGYGINMGPGASSGISYSFNNNLHVPDISNPTNAITYPEFFPDGFCSNQLTLTYTATLAYGPNCIGSVEASDIIIKDARWTVAGSGIADDNFAEFDDQVNYGTDTPGNDTSQLTAALKTGELSIELVSDDVIADSDPATNFSIVFDFPDMQFTSSKFGTGDVRMGNWNAKSFDSNMTITVNNDISSASMTL
jgi:hypothetical protein